MLALTAAVLLAFRDVLGPARGLFFRDHGLVFKPRWHGVVSAHGRGELPHLTRGAAEYVPLTLLHRRACRGLA